MKTLNRSGNVAFGEFFNPATGKMEILTVRYEAIEMTPEEYATTKRENLANVPEVWVQLLRNYVLLMCANQPHVVGTAAAAPDETDRSGDVPGGG